MPSQQMGEDPSAASRTHLIFRKMASRSPLSRPSSSVWWSSSATKSASSAPSPAAALCGDGPVDAPGDGPAPLGEAGGSSGPPPPSRSCRVCSSLARLRRGGGRGRAGGGWASERDRAACSLNEGVSSHHGTLATRLRRENSGPGTTDQPPSSHGALHGQYLRNLGIRGGAGQRLESARSCAWTGLLGLGHRMQQNWEEQLDRQPNGSSSTAGRAGQAGQSPHLAPSCNSASISSFCKRRGYPRPAARRLAPGITPPTPHPAHWPAMPVAQCFTTRAPVARSIRSSRCPQRLAAARPLGR